ncbi:MAG: phosphate ABC transporter permease PstA [Pseudomonadota bacterium]
MNSRFQHWLGSGDPWIWINAGAVSFSLIMVFGLLGLIGAHGLGHFWPSEVVQFKLVEGQDEAFILGEVVDQELASAARLRSLGTKVPQGQEFVQRLLLKIGNRDVFGLDFKWINELVIEQTARPESVIVLEREEWGNFYGFATGIIEAEKQLSIAPEQVWTELSVRLERRHELQSQIKKIEKSEIGGINFQLERLRLRKRSLELKNALTANAGAEIEAREQQLQAEYETLNAELSRLYQEQARDVLLAKTVGGDEVRLPLAQLVRAYRPNQMSVGEKIAYYLAKLIEFVSTEPREANTEGGVFPAIFGTVMMVLIMSLFVAPFGVVAAIYLREYARQGPVTRTIRIAVNNLAGVPSVVYGVFGLGFFVYFLGGSIDRLFYAAALPAPTFGTPGMLWSSLTLAILTVPVVIVATEEGLARIPRAIRDGSLALGATKAETLWRIVLPMATPAMMTGLILAVARAAGEVAPLMMVGVVKLAPSLPLDGNAPFLHLDRKFMHLGFHIYDVGFQSPNVEAARPLVYATALLLIVIIVALNLAAIMIRNRLREKYSGGEG